MNALTWPKLDAWRDHGLMLLRVGMGLSFVVHGWPKLMGGPEGWANLGGTMAGLGITFAPTFWGFMAAVTEVFGGLFLAIGFATRPVSLALWFTMVVAMKMHLDNGDGFRGYSHAMEDGIVFAALVFMGAGRLSVDAWLQRRAQG